MAIDVVSVQCGDGTRFLLVSFLPQVLFCRRRYCAQGSASFVLTAVRRSVIGMPSPGLCRWVWAFDEYQQCSRTSPCVFENIITGSSQMGNCQLRRSVKFTFSLLVPSFSLKGCSKYTPIHAVFLHLFTSLKSFETFVNLAVGCPYSSGMHRDSEYDESPGPSPQKNVHQRVRSTRG